jgi:hypothetical protein
MKPESEIQQIGRRLFSAADFWRIFISPFEPGADLVSATPEAPIGPATHERGLL